MAKKKSKVIKQQKKQIKKLKARIAELSEEMKRLQHRVNTGRAFSENEVELAEETTEDAGEVEEIMEKVDR
jgi:cell division protein FtsB